MIRAHTLKIDVWARHIAAFPRQNRG